MKGLAPRLALRKRLKKIRRSLIGYRASCRPILCVIVLFIKQIPSILAMRSSDLIRSGTIINATSDNHLDWFVLTLHVLYPSYYDGGRT